MHRAGVVTANLGGLPTENGDSVVTLDQVPCWSDSEYRYSYENEDSAFSNSYFPDPLTSVSEGESRGNGLVSRFPVDHEINSKIYLWMGNPWNLEVDAVVNSTNENLDEAQSSPGLYAATGPGLAEECATLDGCRTGMAKITNAYNLPARRVIHTVGPKYAVKYHTAAENALSHCYRSCLEILIESGLQSIAVGCIYKEAKNYPREPAAHVAIRTHHTWIRIWILPLCPLSKIQIRDTENNGKRLLRHKTIGILLKCLDLVMLGCLLCLLQKNIRFILDILPKQIHLIFLKLLK